MKKTNAKAKTKTEARKEREPAAPKTRKTLDQLLAGANAYEKAIAAHVLARKDAALEAAIVERQRSVADCLRYIAGEARKRAHGANCVMMADDEVFGLAVHFFLDGDTPSGVEAGAGVDASAAGKAGEGDGAPRRHQKIKRDAKEEKKPAKAERRRAAFTHSRTWPASGSRTRRGSRRSRCPCRRRGAAMRGALRS